MKIEGSRPPEGQGIQFRTQKADQPDPASGLQESTRKVARSDQVHLSDQAKELEGLKQIVNQLPEIRTEKVEALKKSIQDGTYKVDSLQVAGKILEEI
jgi:negative regulator of flagellin synthesis FlgM